MPINYECLGRNDKIRKRRYDVLTYHVQNAHADDIAKALNITRKMVYKDLDAIYKTNPPNLPLDIVKHMQNSAFELKIRELEAKSSVTGISITDYGKLQDLVLKNRLASLKLMGLLNDKVELSGEVKTVLEVRYEDPPNDE